MKVTCPECNHEFDIKEARRRARINNTAFMKPVQPDALLAKIIGDKARPRTEITKELWEYIMRNKLQDPKNKRMINCSGDFRKLMDGKSQVSMFEMTAIISKHVKFE